MATLDWHATGSDGVTLVELLVTSDVPERVRIENRLDGPVWPPRRQGIPAAGWTDDGYEGVVTPEDRLVLGYASPADPVDPPARIASATPPADAEPTDPTPEDVVRALGDPAPRATPSRRRGPQPPTRHLVMEHARRSTDRKRTDRRPGPSQRTSTRWQPGSTTPNGSRARPRPARRATPWLRSAGPTGRPTSGGG